MRKSKLWLALAAGTMISPLAFAFTNPPYPHIAAMLYGSTQNYDNAAFEAQLARVSVGLLSYWPGWNTGRSKTFDQSMQAVKAINPNFVGFIYCDENEIGQANSSAGYQNAWWNELAANNWWLYTNGSSGNKVLSAWQGGGGPFYQINNTLFVPPDSNGNRWTDYFAKWVAANDQTPNPNADGIFTDNVSWEPPVTADWNRDGTTDSPSNATAQQWYRQGFVEFFNTLRSQIPGKYLMGNMSNWINPGAVMTEYQGQLNGGLIEGTLGYSWSVETWGGWQAMMTGYRIIMAAAAAPKLVIVHQIGDGTTGSNTDDYQAMRYGLASTLMDDGYFAFNSNAGENDLPWFDEYNANLGTEVSSPPTTAWQKGVYRRDFTNGIALVNPKGNGVQTVTLETTYVRLAGTQVPSVNSGASTTTVTLQDRDGILLLRTAPVAASSTSTSSSSSSSSSASGSSAVAVPDAPQILSVQ